MSRRSTDATWPLNWVLCFLAGGLAGASLAVLLAPRAAPPRSGSRPLHSDDAALAERTRLNLTRRSETGPQHVEHSH
jgi:hypothetical protein